MEYIYEEPAKCIELIFDYSLVTFEYYKKSLINMFTMNSMREHNMTLCTMIHFSRFTVSHHYSKNFLCRLILNCKRSS